MIDYSLIADAIDYYQDNGYKLIDAPWTVSEQALKITTTKEHNIKNNEYLDKYLVGSAEQSFLELIKRNKLRFGKYCAVTPCFRNDEEDELHQKYFMKLELIHYADNWWTLNSNLEMMIHDAQTFFSLFTDVSVVKTNDDRSQESYDIEHNGIELGSYGIRNHENIRWIYGTGLAEPRFSNALKN